MADLSILQAFLGNLLSLCFHQILPFLVPTNKIEMNRIYRKRFRQTTKSVNTVVKKLHLKTIWRFATWPFRMLWKIYMMGCQGFLIVIFLMMFLLSTWGNVQDHVKSVFFRSYNAQKFHLATMNTIAADILKSAEQREYEKICQHFIPYDGIENCPKLSEEFLESRRYAFKQHRGIQPIEAYFSEDMKSAETVYLARYLSDKPGSNPFSGIEMEISFVQKDKTWQVSDFYWILYEKEDMPNVPTVWGVQTQL